METKLELLAPAKNLEQGKAAIDHGADAVYIGAPLFGARMAAGNSIEDIAELVKYAHLFGSKVFATVNTLLFDNELQAAEKLMWNLYDIGVDAAIVQDMGILEMNLPPIELHASTQTHNIDPQRVKFLEQVGLKRIILARETSLEQMRALRQQTNADLEAFIQGALCVCYSGQCYMSQYLNGRSGNRGACSQPCRSAYDLVNSEGKRLRHNEHLLSLKDFSAAQHIESMIYAGITSFKIEGRLKDISYVKNVTAFYRQLLDSIIARHAVLSASSSGKTRFFFTPDLERTFNRGFTDYFLTERQKIASHATQKSIGKKIGKVVNIHGNTLTINSYEPLTAGDGICYFNEENQLEGFLVNHINGNRITANKPLSVASGTELWRNNDYAFEKKLQGNTSERKIAVSMTVEDSNNGLRLTATDEDGCSVVIEMDCDKSEARDMEKARENMTRQLSKLGGTAFETSNLTLKFKNVPFIPASVLNELRRHAIAELCKKRIQHYSPKDNKFVPNELPYYNESVDYRANIINNKAEAFYRRHKAECTEHGVDETKDYDGKALMTTKYCLRYELGECLKCKCNKEISKDYRGDLFLVNNGNFFRLEFDCKRCEMKIFTETSKKDKKLNGNTVYN